MKFKPLYFAIVIFVLATVGLIYTQLGNAQKTVPKVKLSYFSNLGVFSEAIQGRLQQEILAEKSFWFVKSIGVHTTGKYFSAWGNYRVISSS